MAVTATQLIVKQWEGIVLTVTQVPTTNITGWLFAFRMRNKDGTLLLSKDSGAGIAITNAAGGVYTVSLTSNDLGAVPVGVYDYDIFRTNAGTEAGLVFGEIEVRPQTLKPAA